MKLIGNHDPSVAKEGLDLLRELKEMFPKE